MQKESSLVSHMITLWFLLLHAGAAISYTSPPPPARPRFHGDEKSALLEFKTTYFTKKSPCCDRYYSESRQPVKLESWKAESGDQSNGDCCAWDGVECDEVSGHVIGLDLSCGCLSGPFDSKINSIFRLSHLQSLNLALNDFNFSHIPLEVGNLSFIRDLNLGSSFFMGRIPPSLGNLTQLTHLDLSLNFLIGPFPSQFQQLTQLTHLDTSGNYLTKGILPSCLGNLSQLAFLDLWGNSFVGKIPHFLGNLTQLTNLNLQDNYLTGEIPSSIGNLVRLTFLDLGANKLTGGIPFSFENLLKLKFLSLDSNELTGEIPSVLGKLTQLTSISLSFNKFYGLIPNEIVELQGLGLLDLLSNNLSGVVRLDLFSNAQSLDYLMLSFNKLSLIIDPNITKQYSFLALASCNISSFPKFLQHQHGLNFLELSNNYISGPVPKWFLNVSITSLTNLNLSSNFLTSFTQDPVIFKWTNILRIDLRFNELQGSLPIPPPHVLFYYISNNRLVGQFSLLLCNLSSIKFMDLSDNYLFGELPQCLGNLSGILEAMSLRNNRFHGKIPQLNRDKCTLRMIDLSYNQLQGPLSRELAKCEKLEFLSLRNNKIGDTFPSWLGSVLVLRVLILRSNRFHGVIEEPTSSLEFPMLHIIDLAQNNFSGRLPYEYFKQWTSMQVSKEDRLNYIGDDNFDYLEPSLSLSPFGGIFYYSMIEVIKGIQMNYSKVQASLTFVDLSSNNFKGMIPETIGRLKILQLLNLSNNVLIGPLPLSLTNLTNLEALDLSRNQLNGEIPQELTQLTFLAVFNVSYNNMTGPIPQARQFGTFKNSSYLGNLGLCGIPLSQKCGQIKALPQSLCTSK